MTKQKWILLSLCVGILWGTDTLFQSLWEDNQTEVTQSNPRHSQVEKVEFEKIQPMNVKANKKTLNNRPVKVVSTDKGAEALKAVKSPSPKKTNLDDLAKKYDKKLEQKKKVPKKNKEQEDEKNKKIVKNSTTTYSNRDSQRSARDNDFFSDSDSDSDNYTGGEFSVITPNPEEVGDNNLRGGGAFNPNSEMTVREWTQTLTNNPADSDVSDFIAAVRQGDIEMDEAYELVESLLRSEDEKNHSNAVKVIMSIKSEKSFVLLTDIVSGSFSEDIVASAYSGLLNYRSFDDLAIIESVLKRENLSLSAIYFSADTILQLSQQNIPTYGDNEQRTVTMLEAYNERFLALTDLLQQSSSGVAEQSVLDRVNQTVAYIGGPDAIADGSVAKPGRRAMF